MENTRIHKKEVNLQPHQFTHLIKSQLMSHLAEATLLSRKDVSAVLEELANVMHTSSQQRWCL